MTDCQLHIQDLYPDVLKLMLQHMYGCLETMSVEAAPMLFSASDRYVAAALSIARSVHPCTKGAERCTGALV